MGNGRGGGVTRATAGAIASIMAIASIPAAIGFPLAMREWRTAHAARSAGAFPAYDAAASCRNGSRDVAAFNGCMERERSSYDRVRTAWSTLPVATRDRCRTIAWGMADAWTEAGGDYGALARCVGVEGPRAVASFPEGPRE